jgi:hypothetical protein
MDARTMRCLTAAFSLLALCRITEAATFQTVNFAVTADNPEVAEKVGKAAEVYRQQLAIFWLGKALPNWSRPCKISVREGALGAGGQTTFQFTRGEVLNWRMSVQGSLERILDSVLPHEVNHTVFACHFRRPLPRWADEGAATLFEHRSEQVKQLSLLNEVIRNKHELISLRDLLAMKEYPRGQRPMLTLYAQGYALADFLVQQKGRHAYLKFISDGERGNWEDAIRANFDHDGIESLEKNWRGWVLAGMPKLTLPRDQMLAANEETPEAISQAAARPEIVADQSARSALSKPRRSLTGATVRLQSPDPQRTKSQSQLTTDVEPKTIIRERVDTVEAEQSRAVKVKSGRELNFEAPVPRSWESRVRKIADPAVGGDEQVDASGLEELLPDLTDADAEQELRNSEVGSSSEVAERRLQLERTGSVKSRGLVLPADGSSGKSVELNGVLLPRERSGNSGSTPQWAGFPGQKKLF